MSVKHRPFSHVPPPRDPPTPPPPSETKLKEALDSWERAYNEEPVTSSHHGFGGFKDWDAFDKAHADWQAKLTAARSSLESLYREQMTELVELRDIKAFAAHKLQQYLDELSALRSLQITESEAELLLADMHHDSNCRTSREGEEYDCDCQSEAIIEKLRRISSKATSEEL